MEHEVLNRLLATSSANAALAGSDLREAAQGLLGAAENVGPGVVLWAVDEAGERIIGAASVLREDLASAVDRSRPNLDGRRCLLVSGYAAGPVALADRAKSALQLGAAEVAAAVLGGWDGSIESVERVYALAGRRAHAA